MNIMFAKLKKTLAIALVALQIPMLMLWKITYDAVKLACHELEIMPGGGYTLAFQEELLIGAIVAYLPLILSLLACFVLSVWSLILLIKRKGYVGIVGISLNAVSLVACGFVLYAFATHSYISEGQEYLFDLSEFMSFRYFMGSELDLCSMLPLWTAMKYIVLGLHLTGNAVLCGLGIAELVMKKTTPPAVEEKENADV